MTATARSAIPWLAAHLRERVFAPRAASSARRIGAEIEFIPVDAASRLPAPLVGDAPTATLGWLRPLAARAGWVEQLSPKGVSCWTLPDGGALTFEPGGQIEYASAPCDSASLLIRRLQAFAAAATVAAADAGVDLLSVGIDPCTPVECAPLRLGAERYLRMARWFASHGPAGARMMRQTASIQVSLDYADDVAASWRVSNAMAPYLTALFANSRRYAGRDSGHASFRAHCWRTLDPSRTGVPWDGGDPAAAYLEFALDASNILVGPDDGDVRPFGDWVNRHPVTEHDWEIHLSTLFPEVRPRGFLEVRSIDALSPECYAAPIVMLAGVLYDPASRAAAAELLGDPDPRLLVCGGTLGMADASIARTARALAEIALSGCERLGTAFVGREDVEVAREYFAGR